MILDHVKVILPLLKTVLILCSLLLLLSAEEIFPIGDPRSKKNQIFFIGFLDVSGDADHFKIVLGCVFFNKNCTKLFFHLQFFSLTAVTV